MPGDMDVIGVLLTDEKFIFPRDSCGKAALRPKSELEISPRPDELQSGLLYSRVV
jgi:hypothetical protein